MKKVLIIGSGISGLSCAIECAQSNMQAILVSPFPSERSQSVMAAGGINAVLNNKNGDSVSSHIEDTLKGGCYIAGKESVSGLCAAAPQIIQWLEKLGTVFSINSDGTIAQRAFGGQSFNRTCYCGASTGKQIVSALVMEARHYEGLGKIIRRYWTDFYSALIKDGVCYGAIVYNESMADLEMIRADSVVMATGGQNALFGKTTGSSLCDGYAEGKLFMQGAELKNLEFIQYHPTKMETAQKKMLISEAVRGEGGRLFYEADGNRVYFMEKGLAKKEILCQGMWYQDVWMRQGRMFFWTYHSSEKKKSLESLVRYMMCASNTEALIFQNSASRFLRPSIFSWVGLP